MDIDNSDTGNPGKHSLPNGRGSAIVNSVEQTVKRNAKSVIVPCTIIKEPICYIAKGRALVTKLPNLPKDGKVNGFDFISGKVHCLTLLSFYSEILITSCIKNLQKRLHRVR